MSHEHSKKRIRCMGMGAIINPKYTDWNDDVMNMERPIRYWFGHGYRWHLIYTEKYIHTIELQHQRHRHHHLHLCDNASSFLHLMTDVRFLFVSEFIFILLNTSSRYISTQSHVWSMVCDTKLMMIYIDVICCLVYG